MPLKEFDLDGKVAIVTGAGRGIGRSIALTLAEAGADVVAVARTVKEIEETAEEVCKMGRRGLAVAADLCKEQDVARMVEKTIEEFGRIDILVNNAGAVLLKPVVPATGQRVVGADPATDLTTPISIDEWQRVLNVNLTSIFLCCRAVGPHMIEQGYGCLLYTSDAADDDQSEGFFQDEGLLQAALKSLPLRRVGEARDIGLLSVYLASDASKNMTGQNIYIDQGLSIS